MYLLNLYFCLIYLIGMYIVIVGVFLNMYVIKQEIQVLNFLLTPHLQCITLHWHFQSHGNHTGCVCYPHRLGV